VGGQVLQGAVEPGCAVGSVDGVDGDVVVVGPGPEGGVKAGGAGRSRDSHLGWGGASPTLLVRSTRPCLVVTVPVAVKGRGRAA
jgi:hypothetical protein